MFSQVRWLRVVIAAFLIEVGLAVTGLPFLLILPQPVVFRVVVPVVCLIVPFIVTLIAARPLPTARTLNGLLTGVVATAMYFVLVIATSSIAEASAAYGLLLFIGVNALRIVSAAAGGYVADRRALPSAVTS